MNKSRMEAFSDGVIAIILTIMVLELHPPVSDGFSDVLGVMPSLLVYALSFIYLAIYWNNHHHLLQAAHKVSGRVLWANLHLLFWISLIPFVTSYLARFPLQPVPVAVYGLDMICAGTAYWLLVRALLGIHEKDSVLARAIGPDIKGKISVAIYALGVGLAFVEPILALAAYVLVALIWFIPDRRIERVL